MLPAMIKFHYLLCLYVFIWQCAANTFSFQAPNDALQTRQSPATPLVDFQVSQPILTPSGTSDQYGCIYTQTLMTYVFSNSYNAPFVGQYTPPPCTFNRATMNLTVTSKVPILGTHISSFETYTEPRDKSWEYVIPRRLLRIAIPPQISITDSEIIYKGSSVR